MPIVFKNEEGKVISWMSESFHQTMINFGLEAERRLHDPNWKPKVLTPEEEFLKSLRYGFVDDMNMVKIDPKTMIAYKIEGTDTDWYALKFPLEEAKYNNFIRWSRGMDF